MKRMYCYCMRMCCRKSMRNEITRRLYVLLSNRFKIIHNEKNYIHSYCIHPISIHSISLQ